MATNKIKTVALAVFLLFAGFATAFTKTYTNMTHPDFAFPKDVEKSSVATLESALKAGKYEDCLRAAINYVVASNLISKENVVVSINKIDSISSLLPSPYKAICRILEAQIYVDIYNSNRWQFDNRTVDSDLENANPAFWDRSIFSKKIKNLSLLALQEKEAASEKSLSSIASLLDHIPEVSLYTFYDLIVYKVIDFYETFGPKDVIPFFDNSKDGFPSPVSLLDQLIELHPEETQPRIMAVLTKCNYLTLPEKEKLIAEEIKISKKELYLAQMLNAYNYIIFSQQYGNEREIQDFKTTWDKISFYELIISLKDRFDSKVTADYIDPLLCNMKTEAVKLEFPSRVRINADFDVKAEVENISKFYIILLEYNNPQNSRITLDNMSRFVTKIDYKEITVDSQILFTDTLTTRFKITKPGIYTLIASASPDFKDIIKRDKYIQFNKFEASDIDLLTIGMKSPKNTHGKKEGCFVIMTQNGAPVKGADVTFKKTTNWNSSKKEESRRQTDSKGYASSPYESANVYASYKGSCAESNLYSRGYAEDTETSREVYFTDRQIYRPGDTVKFLVISFTYTPFSSQRDLRCGEHLNIILKNANHEDVDTLKLTTDEAGRAFGEFIIPKDGLLGSWYLSTRNSIYNFQVAEYKTPSFLVNLEKKAASSDSIEFSGKALTYSGMPVTDAKVMINVVYSPFKFFFNDHHNNETYSATLYTDATGGFVIKFPLNNLNPENYHGIFTVDATVTDNAGETIKSNTEMFWIANSFTISSDIPDKIKVAEKPVAFTVKVNDIAGLPVVKTIHCQITDSNGKEVFTSEFESPIFYFNPQMLTSGQYKLTFSINDNDTVSQSYKTIIFRGDEIFPPVKTCLWVPETTYVTQRNENKTDIKFGCSYAGQYILMYISDSKGNEEFKWIKSEGNNTSFEVENPEADTRKFITLCCYRDHKFYNTKITLIPCEQIEKLEINTESFRNSIEPGEVENWKFTLHNTGKPAEGYAYALLYDKALDALADLRWNTSFYSPSFADYLSINGTYDGNSVVSFYKSYCKNVSIPKTLFEFETYGYPLYSGFKTRGKVKYRIANSSESITEEAMPMLTDAKSSMASGAMNDFAEATMDIYEKPVSDTGSEFGIAGKAMAGVEQVRPIELPVAFFKPDLYFDKSGELTIDFTAPNFNTTWKFIMGVYNRELQTASIVKEIVASKKVMVKMNSPRFLRTGDNATITATVYNNSEESCEIWGDFTIFDPVTNETLTRVQSESFLIEPSGNRVVTIEYNCPSNINSLGIRVFAKSGKSSDGEQTIIPVLPSSQPIIESDPFYLQPGQRHYEMKIPDSKDEAVVTFKYNDNPVWEVVTALPPIITPDNESLTSQITALYGNCVGRGIMDKNPTIAKGLSMIIEGEAGDGMLISNLEKDQGLKTVTLNNTPWVNNAKSETLRLSKLGSLLETTLSYETINNIWNKILNLQHTDGGWSWCEGMKSSRWITEAVLLNIGLLKQGGYFPKLHDSEKTIKKALYFVDKEITQEYAKLNGDKEWFLTSIINYIYSRSFFPENSMTAEFKEVAQKALDCYEKTWKKMSIFRKATIAVTLWRYNRKTTALQILESLKQYSSESPEKGIWFDNLDSDWRGAGKLLTTSRVVMAFHEINPEDTIIDRIRQWMLLQRQSQDWQEGLWSIDAIDALLTTGTQWTGEYSLPIIEIAGKRINVNDIARLTGEVTTDIVLSCDKSNTVVINRDATSPAWGGIISQYTESMDKVKDVSIADLSIQKEFWRINNTPEGTTAVKTNEFKIGDKIRVSMIIDCGRDMDFVALTDQRPACIEPANQLSDYTNTDGLWCYLETRNSATNLFFDFMPRGRHIVSYEAYITEEGEFANGVATLQCLYSPLLTAHSSGFVIKVTK